jgi:parvulin-like peptidyl-prolyl isomerase
MGKINVIPFCLLLILINYSSLADETRLLARDDIYQYNIMDLGAYLNVFGDPNSELIMKVADTTTSSPAARNLFETTLKSLAFKKLFVHNELKNEVLNDSMRLFIRDAMREYALKLYNIELQKECAVTSKEVELAYEQSKESFRVDERRKIAVLYKVFPDDRDLRERLPGTLETLRARPDFNENFLEYVKQYSDLPGALEGGVVDYFARGTYGPTVEKYAFDTPKGGLSPVFTAQYGAYIIKCIDIKPEGYISLIEVSSKIGETIAKEKWKDALERRMKNLGEQNKIYIPEQIPQQGNPELVLLRVNDYSLTSGTLFTTYTELSSLNTLPNDFKSYLANLSDKEAILQQLEKQFQKNAQLPAARELEWVHADACYKLLFPQKVKEQIQFKEEEAREYYEKYKEFYHGISQKRLAYLIIKPPDEKSLIPPVYHKKLNKLQRSVLSLREKMAQNPENFITEAKKFANNKPDVTFNETNWLEELPDNWKLNTSLIEYPKGAISQVLATPNGFIIFKVTDEKKPRILSYDEVKDKVRRVIMGMKVTKLSKEIQDKMLKDYHFRLLINNP